MNWKFVFLKPHVEQIQTKNVYSLLVVIQPKSLDTIFVKLRK